MQGEIAATPASTAAEPDERGRPGAQVRLVIILTVLAALFVTLALPVCGASPSPAASGTTSLTGHWAIAGTSGIDLVQRGAALTGTSMMGISLSGTVNGRDIAFRWWRGPSYGAAKRADRGTGQMSRSADGEELAIAAKDDEAGPGPFPLALQAIRVHDIVSATASPKIDWYGDWYGWTAADLPKVASYGRAYLDYLATAWLLTVQTGYWPSPAVVWIQVENQYAREGRLMVGGWLPNGGGPGWVPPSMRR
jgi:hypothetical protein